MPPSSSAKAMKMIDKTVHEVAAVGLLLGEQSNFLLLPSLLPFLYFYFYSFRLANGISDPEKICSMVSVK